MDVDVEVPATWVRGMGALPWQQRLVSVDGVWADGFSPTECCGEFPKGIEENKNYRAGQDKSSLRLSGGLRPLSQPPESPD